MSLTKYQILISALEHGSLTAAAEELGYTQSGVSHMLNSLESELGVQLVVRSRTGVRPTTTGEILIPYMKRVLGAEQNFEQALSEITDLLKGKLVIGSFTTASSFFLPKIISEFQKMYPNISYELRGGTYEEIEQWIDNREVDCGFVSLPTKKNFKTIPILNDRLVVVTGKHYKHNFNDETCVTLKELEKENIILIDGKDDYDRTNLFAADINKLKVKITTSDAYATVRMIENNLGVGILPIYLAYNFSDTLDLFELDESLHESRTLAFAYLSKKEASPIVKKFISFIESKHIKTE
ncbi:MAG: LysR family transcriptional regulator [Firmicutes bacterium]|nr:LysR family transcriptional regulator [Bacillota bacterium]